MVLVVDNHCTLPEHNVLMITNNSKLDRYATVNVNYKPFPRKGVRICMH